MGQPIKPFNDLEPHPNLKNHFSAGTTNQKIRYDIFCIFFKNQDGLTFLTPLPYQFETIQIPFQFGQQLTISFLDMTYFGDRFSQPIHPAIWIKAKIQ